MEYWRTPPTMPQTNMRGRLAPSQAAYALLTSMMLEEITPRFAAPRS